MTAAKWTVRKGRTLWIVQPPYPMNQTRHFVRWRDAYDFAHRMAGGLA